MRTILQSARVLLAVLTVLVPPGIEAATILLDDGGVHTLSGPSDPVAVANGTTLILQDGAVIPGGPVGRDRPDLERHGHRRLDRWSNGGECAFRCGYHHDQRGHLPGGRRHFRRRSGTVRITSDKFCCA